MKEIVRTSPVSDLGTSLQAQTEQLLKSHLAEQDLLPAVVQPPAPVAGKSLLAKAFAGLSDLVKSQVKGYTRKDGVTVAPHANKVQKHSGPITSHPNYHPDDHAALKEKGYDDGEISAIWDRDRAQGSFEPNPRNDLKLPTAEHPNGQPGPAAKAAAAAKKPKADKKALAAASAKASQDAGGKMEKTGPLGLTPQQLDDAASTLANDEDSTDEELASFLGDELKVSPEQAQAIVAQRDTFLQSGPADQTAEKLGALLAAVKPAGGTPKDAKGAAPAQKENPGATPAAAPAAAGAAPRGTDAPAEPKPQAQAASDEAAAAAPQGEAPPQADANAAGWDQLPDEANPKHSLSAFDSKSLGKLATMKPEHAKAHAHQELAARGLDQEGNWQGFDKAKAAHAGSIPGDFAPVHGNDPDKNHFQTVKTPVLTAAAKGHLDLQKRARAELAGRGHDTQGNWIGFDKANALHGVDGKTGQAPAEKGAKPAAKKPAGGAGAAKGPQQAELFKALKPGQRPMFFVHASRADDLHRAMNGGGSGG